MIHIEDYCNTNNISRRWAEKQIKRGDIPSVKLNGRTMILEPKSEIQDVKHAINREHVNTFKKECKRELRIKNEELRIAKENGEDIKGKLRDLIAGIRSRVEKFEEATGIQLCGLSAKSLYAIASAKRNIDRKSRADKFGIRNKALANPVIYDKALNQVNRYFGKDANGSLSLAIDLALDYAKTHEELWEIANLSKSTLYSQINKQMHATGARTVHQYLNHFNTWINTLVTNIGSFTDDTPFGVWYVDDHKFDVAGALVQDKNTGKFSVKQLNSWFIIEGRTSNPIGWDIRTNSFKDDDIIMMFITAFMQHGLPTKIVCDNGLAADPRVRRFFQKVGVELEVAPPYDPTFKAIIERFFLFFKEETDCFQNDFVGSKHHTEGRHSTMVLSPDETLQLEHEAMKRYEDYINGFLINRLRKMSRPDVPEELMEKGKISIKTLYEFYYCGWQRRDIDAKRLRYAFSEEVISKEFCNMLKFKGEEYMPATETSIMMNNKKYRICYMPNDLSMIDLYSLEGFVDGNTGQVYEKDEWVMTLRRIRDMADKKQRVFEYNHKIKKATKALARELSSSVAPEMPVYVTNEGKTVDTRKIAQKVVEKALEETITHLPKSEEIAAQIPVKELRSEDISDEKVAAELEGMMGKDSVTKLELGNESSGDFDPDTYDWEKFNKEFEV